MSSSACSKLRPENSSIVPSTPRAALGWRGASTRSLNGECTTPIGRTAKQSAGWVSRSELVTCLQHREHFGGVALGLHVAENARNFCAADHECRAVDALVATLLRAPDSELVGHA